MGLSNTLPEGFVPFHIEEPHVPTWMEQISAFSEIKWVRYTWLAANIFYSAYISMIFAGFAYRRGEDNPYWSTVYAFSSFVANAPMSFFFFKRMFDAFKQLIKGEKAFITCFVFALALAIGTSSAGFEVAKESAEGFEFIENNIALSGMATGFSLFNTFSTRFVGTAYLLYDAWCRLKKRYQQQFSRYAAYYLLQEDIKKFGPKTKIKFLKDLDSTDAERLKRYSRALYPAMIERGLRPGNSWKDTLIDTAMLITTVAITVLLMVNLIPLWIDLTVEGAEKIPGNLENSTAFVLFASVSSELFYVYSGLTFSGTLVRFTEQVYKWMQRKWNQNDSKKTAFALVVPIAVCLVLWAGIAYCSGGGYGEDGFKVMQGGFSDMAEDLWFSWMGWFTDPFVSGYDQVATVSAGLIVNGGSMLNFCLNTIHYLKEPAAQPDVFDHQEATEALDSMIKNNKFDARVSNQVTFRRKRANPHLTLWDRYFGEKTGERDALIERSPLNKTYS